MDRLRRPAAGCLVALLVLGTLAATPSAAGSPAVTTRKVLVAPGVTYRRIEDPRGPYVIHVLKIRPMSAATIDTALAGSPAGTFATTSSIGIGEGAIAAVNGDFGGEGLPLNTWAGDGILQSSGSWGFGAAFGFRPYSSGGGINRGTAHVRATDKGRGVSVHVAGWNVGAPHDDEVRGYTMYASSELSPPATGCAVRLAPKTGMKWAEGRIGLDRPFIVRARRCGDGMDAQPGTIVLASKLNGRGANWISALKRDGTVQIHWDIAIRGVLDAVGGTPVLVQDGRVVAPKRDTYLCQRHPRTAVGVTATGAILLVAVDGRERESIGMIPRRLGSLMRSLGSISALNLDGGGSTTMWVKGLGVVNDPSDGDERPVTNAVVVLPGPDPSDPSLELLSRTSRRRATTAVSTETEVVSGPERLRAIEASLADPGSTGGLVMYAADLGAPRSTYGGLLRRVRQWFSVAA